MRIKQNAVHTNGNTKYYEYKLTGDGAHAAVYAYHPAEYAYHGGYSSHYDSHSNWGAWYDAWGNCSHAAHGNGSSYHGGYTSLYKAAYTSLTTAAYYSDAYSYTLVTNVDTNTNNPSAIVAGTPTAGKPNWQVNTLTIDLSAVTYSDSDAFSKFRIYARYKSTASGTWSEFVQGDETTSRTTYDIDISSIPVGYYQIAITAFDGHSWSAIPTADNMDFTYDHHQAFVTETTTSGTNPKYTTVKVATDTTEYEVAASYALSAEFSVFRYTPPTWLTDPWAKDTIDQLRTEINKARDAFGLTAYTFTNTPVVTDFTVVKVSDITEAQTAVSDLMNTATGSTPTYTQTPIANNTEVQPSVIKEMQDLLDSLS